MITPRFQPALWKCFLTLATAIAIHPVLTSQSQAATILGDPISLSELLGPQSSLLVGDKLFDDFTYTRTGDMPPASAVNVIPIQDDAENYGIRLQGGFVDTPGGGASDALISFRVTVTDPRYQIVDAHLEANLEVLGTTEAAGFIGITETFFPDSEQVMDVFASRLSNGQQDAKLKDWIDFEEPHTVLRVQKDILALAISGDVNFPQASFIDQTFSQEVVPEPGSVALLVLGALGVGLGWRRGQSKRR